MGYGWENSNNEESTNLNKENRVREAKLISIYNIDNEFEIEFNFTWDRHHIITFDKEMTAKQLGELLIKSAAELTRLNDQEDWNRH